MKAKGIYRGADRRGESVEWWYPELNRRGAQPNNYVWVQFTDGTKKMVGKGCVRRIHEEEKVD